jgi:hypothetical protein
MTKYLLLLFVGSFANISWTTTLYEVCKNNHDYLKKMIDNGIIENSSYFSLKDLLMPSPEIEAVLKSMAKLRRERRVNADMLQSRMDKIKGQILRKDYDCFMEAKELHGNLTWYLKDVVDQIKNLKLDLDKNKFTPKGKTFLDRYDTIK